MRLAPEEYEYFDDQLALFRGQPFIHLKQADRRFVIEPLTAGHFGFELVHLFNYSGLRVRSDDPVFTIWQQAATRLRSQISRLHPEAIFVSGDTGRAILGATFDIDWSNPKLQGIPVHLLDAQENFYLYKHSLGEYAVDDNSWLLHYLARKISERCGGRPQNVLLLDDVVGSGLKAVRSVTNFRIMGVPGVSFAALTSPLETSLVHPVGTTHPDYYGFMHNLITAMHFVRSQKAQPTYVPRDGKDAAAFASIPGQIQRILQIAAR